MFKVINISLIISIFSSLIFLFLEYKKKNKFHKEWRSENMKFDRIVSKFPDYTESYFNKFNIKIKNHYTNLKKLYDIEIVDSNNNFFKEGIPLEFQETLKDKIIQIKDLAVKHDCEINDSSNFYLGFDLYRNNIVSREIVNQLKYQLEAIYILLKTLIESRPENISLLKREYVIGEKGGKVKSKGQTVFSYKVRLDFIASEPSFKIFLNKISNNHDFLYGILYLKINSSLLNSPPKDVSFKLNDSDKSNSKASDRVIMGNEKLSVSMLIDISKLINSNNILDKFKNNLVE